MVEHEMLKWGWTRRCFERDSHGKWGLNKIPPISMFWADCVSNREHVVKVRSVGISNPDWRQLWAVVSKHVLIWTPEGWFFVENVMEPIGLMDVGDMWEQFTSGFEVLSRVRSKTEQWWEQSGCSRLEPPVVDNENDHLATRMDGYSMQSWGCIEGLIAGKHWELAEMNEPAIIMLLVHSKVFFCGRLPSCPWCISPTWCCVAPIVANADCSDTNQQFLNLWHAVWGYSQKKPTPAKKDEQNKVELSCSSHKSSIVTPTSAQAVSRIWVLVHCSGVCWDLDAGKWW